MAVNGSEFINDPFNTSYSPFVDLFDKLTGFGNLFWLFPLIVLTIGIYIKTEDAAVTSLFMAISGVLLGSGGIFVGAGDVALAFYIFATLGFVGVLLSVFFNRGD